MGFGRRKNTPGRGGVAPAARGSLEFGFSRRTGHSSRGSSPSATPPVRSAGGGACARCQCGGYLPMRSSQRRSRAFGLICVVGKRYSVPSTLIGHRLRVRLYASEVEYQALIGRYPRLCGYDAYHIDLPPPYPLAHSQAGGVPALLLSRGAVPDHHLPALLRHTLRALDPVGRISSTFASLHLADKTIESRVKARRPARGGRCRSTSP
jgi:hypothetical protein